MHNNIACVTVQRGVAISSMDITKELQDYINNTLGIHIDLIRWASIDNLPLYLSGQFDFFESSLNKVECLFVVFKGAESPTPGTLRKHFDWLSSRSPHKLIFVTDSISSYDRKRMIQQKIAFIVPGKQMYLPPLGIDLREYIQSPRRKIQGGFSPSTQMFFLFAVYQPLDNISSRNFSVSVPYSKMTISRAFAELKERQLLRSHKEGRVEVHSFTHSKKDIWTNNIQYFKSPVIKKYWVKSQNLWEDFLDSGLTALSEYTTLSPPSYRTVAINRRKWTVRKNHDSLIIIPSEEPGATLVELWSYEPQMLSKGNIVDPLSLYLIFKDNPDERIQSACSKLIERVQW